MILTAEVIAQVTRHMNDDHAGDCLLICRGLGGVPDATAARMTGLDGSGFEFVATVDGDEVPVRVPFAEPVTERAQLRTEAVRMCREAAHRLPPG